MAIYNVEVESHTSTFDLVPRTLDDQRRWIAERSGAFSAVVASIGDEVVGFASLSPYKERRGVPHHRRELGVRVARPSAARDRSHC